MAWSLLLALLATASGCGEPRAVELTRDLVNAGNSLCDTLQEVRDATSARAAMTDLDTRCAKYAESLRALERDMASGGQAPGRQLVGDELNRNAEDAIKKLFSEMRRIDDLMGLPTEFWAMIYPRVIEIEIAMGEVSSRAGKPVDAKKIESLRQIQTMLTQQGYQKVVIVYLYNLPIQDLEQVAKKISANTGAPCIYGAGINLCQVTVAPVADFNAFAAKLDLGTITARDEGRRLLKITCGPTSARPKTQPAASDETAKTAESKCDDLDSHSFNYFEKLLERLTSDNIDKRREAIDILLRVKPEKVASSQTRKKIARAFKEMALDKENRDRDKAVQGLAHWAGTYSVPALLDILKEKNCAVEEEVLEALGSLKDVRAAEPVVAKLTDLSTHDIAYSCLKEMGPVAEDAVLAAAGSKDARVALAAIQLLGEIGTDNSVPFLKTALKKGAKPDIKFCARAALRAIAARQGIGKIDEE